MTVILRQIRTPAADKEPEIDLVAGVPEVFADVLQVTIINDVVRVLLARQLEPFGHYEQVGLLLMPVSGWRRSHLLAREIFEHGCAPVPAN